MSMFLSIVGSTAVFLGIIGVGALGLWLAYGRTKKSEDKAIGVLKEMAIFQGASSYRFNSPRHR